MTRRSAPAEQGLTLIELVVAVAIMGIAFVTIVAGMMTSIFTSDVHRRQATSETILKNLAETGQKASYHECTTNPKVDYGLSVPSGYTYQVLIAYGDSAGASFSSSLPASCPTADNGLQRLTVTVTDPTGRDAEGPLDLVKRRPT